MSKIRLFLSSPGDVETERQKVHAVVAQLNRMLGPFYQREIEVLDWKTHVVPDMGRTQEVVNRQIQDYDIFVGIMWKRFGTPTGAAESGTEEEFNRAYQNWQQFRRPRILFYFSQADHTPKSKEETKQWLKVLDFKEQFTQKGLYREYPSAEEFDDILREHLAGVLSEWFGKDNPPPPVADFNRYLKFLREENMYLDIKGLASGEGRAYSLRIDQLYIPLKTSSLPDREEHRGKKSETAMLEMAIREIPLEAALQQSRLIIKGEPGAGKTTFLRLLTFSLCQKWLGEAATPTTSRLLWRDPPPLPILVRLGRLAEYIQHCKQHHTAHAPVALDSPECLFQFLDNQSRENNWKVTAADFRRELEAGHCVIFLDGLDEAPDLHIRETISELAARLQRAYPACQVVLTSRPPALTDTTIPAGFALVEIAPLDDQAMQVFLKQWCAALYAESPAKAQQHQQELFAALQARPDIRRMTRTPVMLTALAVVHWHENRLPEQRVELYESILGWLFKQRATRTGRLKADRCRKLLQKLALAMFEAAPGRLRQMTLHQAARAIMVEFDSPVEREKQEQAEYFLRDEMVDSGIIVERARRLEFWHLSFQEYLAAFEIAGRGDTEQTRLLFEKERLFQSEWHEVVLLLGGILYKQGIEKINLLIDALIANCPAKSDNQTLPERAKTVALLGGIVQDLSPFDFQPANPHYRELVQSVMCIFEPTTFRKIPVTVRIAAADALGRVGDPRLVNDPMIKIPEGSFLMGAQKNDKKLPNYDENMDADEAPVHQVKLSSFFISKYPVTVGQFRRFVDAEGYRQERYWQNGGFQKFTAPDKWDEQLNHPTRPVVWVSWYEAYAYCVWFREFKGDERLYRLPTEAEWEWAARGPAAAYRKYIWGNKEPDGETANFEKSGVGHASPVGIFPESCSPEGVIDLAGNVYEWCQDWYGGSDFYAKCERQGVVENPQGPTTGSYRVLRGGCWGSEAQRCRSANRGGISPEDRSDALGFRLVFVP